MKKHRRGSGLAAVIDVGSRAIRLDVAELTVGEAPMLLESLRREVDLGREVFRSGEISPGGIDMLRSIMADCRRKLDEYRPREVRVSVSDVLRAAANGALVADRLTQVCGVPVEVPGPLDGCCRFAAALRNSCTFADGGAVAVHVDAWSLHLLGFENGVLRFAEDVPVGADRLPEELTGAELAHAVAERLAASGAMRRLKGSFDALPTVLAAAGEGARRIAGFGDELACVREFSPSAFAAAGRKARAKRGVPECSGVVGALVAEFGFTQVLVPGFTLRSALFDADNEPYGDAFAADLAGVCSAFCRRFAADTEYAERTRRVAAELWKKLRSRHAMAERTLPLLEAAALLGGVGGALGGNDDAGERSEYFIDRLPLPGVTAPERRLVAAAVRFAKSGGNAPPGGADTLSRELRPTLFRFAAILRTAAALARSASLAGTKFNIAGGEFVVTPRGAATAAEQAELARGAGLFLRAFGLDPRFGEAAL